MRHERNFGKNETAINATKAVEAPPIGLRHDGKKSGETQNAKWNYDYFWQQMLGAEAAHHLAPNTENNEAEKKRRDADKLKKQICNMRAKFAHPIMNVVFSGNRIERWIFSIKTKKR